MAKLIEYPILFHIEAEKYFLDDINNKVLAEEILESRVLLDDSPGSTRSEDTVWNIKDEGSKLVEQINVLLKRRNLQIIAQWAHIHEPNASSDLHTHPGSDFSFVYYVTVPKGAGHIIFVLKEGPIVNNGLQNLHATIEPEEGVLLLFPSYMYHKVTRNLSKELRISISGNTGPILSQDG